MSKRCSSCGHENRDVAIFCGNCGSRLIANDMANNFTDGNSFTSSNTNQGATSSTAKATANGSNDAGSLCCGVLIVLFIIILIMSMG